MNFTEQCRLEEMGLINQYKELENGIFKERLKHKILHIYWVLSKQNINHDCIMLIFGQINYIQDPPEFTSTNQTYLAKYQESMLLHGVLAEAFRFLKGPENLYNLYQTKYTEEVQNFALQQMGRRRRAEYDDGVPRVVVPSPSPNQ